MGFVRESKIYSSYNNRNIMERKRFLVCFVMLALGIFVGCGDDEMSDPCASDFDQSAMLVNVADNIITPAYASFQDAVNEMNAAANNFINAPSVAELEVFRIAWKNAYIEWQSVAQYEFGSAEMLFLRNSLNNFPANTTAINEKIIGNDYNFDDPEAFDKGFPALDYLLYGIAATPEDIIIQYTTDAAATDRINYLAAIVEDMKVRVDNTVEGWGTYRNDFVNNTGTSAGTGLSLIINNLNQNYELIKRAKFGIPAGVLTLGFTNPTEVEAYYSGISVDLALAAVRASENLYLGASGQGLDDYLNATGIEKNGTSLDGLIQAQFKAAIEAIEVLPSPLSDTIENDRDIVVNAYNEVTKQVLLIKTDLPSALCVAITYIDNPSDSD